MQLIIVSGRSGSGKSTALNVLEDNGFYCIDNLPADFISELVDRAHQAPKLLPQKLAISVDARNLPCQLSRFPRILEQIRQQGHACRLLYLDADDATLLKRFAETRRPHPLTTSGSRSLPTAIQDERQMLAHIADLSDLRIDTSHLNLHQLRELLRIRLLNRPTAGTAFLIQSFGFKRGMPTDADLVFDVRCLPNPYWKPALREYTGLDQPVIDYLDSQPEAEEMYRDTLEYLQKWLPRFAASNRAYLTVAIGCTGGQHRSVYLSERLGKALRQNLPNVQVHHRELS